MGTIEDSATDWQMMSDQQAKTIRIGVDLGGTKIEAIALDGGGNILFRERRPTPANDYAMILDAIWELVSKAEQAAGFVQHIGVGTPGSISMRTGLMRNSNTSVLNGKPLDRDLSHRLGKTVHIENDANCFTLSEATDGAGSRASVVFGVIIGTGVGGGLVVDGKLIAGRNLIAGEWGHNPLPWRQSTDVPDVQCYCGKSGCIETFLSGIGFVRLCKSLNCTVSTPIDAARAADSGDPKAIGVIDVYVDYLARALAPVINLIDPDAIILGGGLSNINRVYAHICAQLSKYVFSDSLTTPILRAAHGDSSGVRGAAWLP
ncbi:MAG TPA: ROK family protein [Steroidobacteraceae bacterium]|nr:ROK family protein [Steroidobacteraceae bacterium]